MLKRKNMMIKLKKKIFMINKSKIYQNIKTKIRTYKILKIKDKLYKEKIKN